MSSSFMMMFTSERNDIVVVIVVVADMVVGCVVAVLRIRGHCGLRGCIRVLGVPSAGTINHRRQ